MGEALVSRSHAVQDMVFAILPLACVLAFGVHTLKEHPALWTPLATLTAISTGYRPFSPRVFLGSIRPQRSRRLIRPEA